MWVRPRRIFQGTYIQSDVTGCLTVSLAQEPTIRSPCLNPGPEKCKGKLSFKSFVYFKMKVLFLIAEYCY